MPCKQKSIDINMRKIHIFKRNQLLRMSTNLQSTNDSKRSFSKLQHSFNNTSKQLQNNRLRTMTNMKNQDQHFLQMLKKRDF